MIRVIYISILLFLASYTFCNADEKQFEKISSDKRWKLAWEDNCTENWRDKWFLDGQRAKVTNSEKGMTFSAGSEMMNDTCHAVLWTKQTFEGDVKIEYDFTRNDEAVKCVNILYIQAVGKGNEPYAKDITEWNHLRIVPHMSTYFENMDALHISYTAFEMKNEDPNADYIRVRRYPVKEGANFTKTTEVEPAFFNTDLFKTGLRYHITYVKTNEDFFMKVEGDGHRKLYHWDISTYPQLQDGHIGLRHMFTRSSIYKNFKIYSAK